MVRWILIGVLALGVTATAVWGYQEHREKNSILVQAENNYQRSFHDLSYHMDLLHDKIGTTLAMNSTSQLSPQLTEIWRLTSEAHTDVGQLPLALLPFNKTEEFLSDIGDFSYRVAVRDLDNKPLSEKEVKSLESLYKQSGEIKDELRRVQNLVLENNLRWMDVQLALASNDENMDNTIIDGFKTVEKTVEGFSEGNFGPTLTGTSKENHGFNYLKGNNISEQEALKKAKDIFNVKDKTKINITKTGKGSELAMYSISYQAGNNHGYMDMSQKGGHPISIMMDRKVKETKLSLNQGLEKAKNYLKKYKFKDVEVFQSNQYSNVGVFSFMYNQDDVRVYPDSIQIKVALDNGDILGLSARDYFRNHHKRDIPEPKINVEEAKEKVNPNVKIQQNHLAIIENDLGEEVLVHEFLGVLGNETYRIFINAMDGKEEQVEKLDGKEGKFESAV